MVPAPQGAAATAFRHGSHLSPTWHTTPRGEQYEKHCKVCHDFDAGQPIGLGAPTRTCAACHFSDPSVAMGDAARLVFEGGQASGGQRPFAYDHALPGHRERACADCHAWSNTPRGDFPYPDVQFAMPAALTVCADCHHHGADDPAAAAQRTLHEAGTGGAWRAAWDRATGCDSCHKAGTPRLLDGHRRATERGFSHASHLPATGGACTECHAMDGAAAATAGMGVLQKGCGDCHFGDRGASTTKLQADLQVERMPTQFSHASKGHREDCSKCHPMAAGARDPDVGRLYADCTKTCHSERRVERHGAWSCNDCHRSGDPRAERDQAAVEAIATVAVQRPAEGSRFRFEAMVHPGITTRGAAVHAAAAGRACADCHRRDLPALAGAAEPRRFLHDGHLAAVSNDTPDTACTACHVTVRDATSSPRTVAFAAESPKERQTCTALCHQSPRLEVEARPTTVDVPVFDHAQHRAHACAECHVRGSDVVALRDAKLAGDGAAFACARCHGHKDPEKIKVTGGYDTTKPNDTCRECHAPKEKPSYQKELRSVQRFQLVADVRQFHDKGGACTNCHGLEQGRPGPVRTPVRIAARLDLHTSHDGVRRPDGSTASVPAVRGTDECLSCHAWDPRRR
ncbi:MAG: hypothetical protein JNL08_05710 [Planctomycetes bacterium]|nr:hypothetical protein [Planctomycetota bacterium]